MQEQTTINTANLTIGETIKNYKELCLRLGVEVYGGSQKRAQLKVFQRYFKWERNKNQYIITDIYDKPKPVEKRKSNNDKYTKWFRVALLNYLIHNKDQKTYSYTTIEWMRNLLGYGNTENDYQEFYDRYNIYKMNMKYSFQVCVDRLKEDDMISTRNDYFLYFTDSKRKLTDAEYELFKCYKKALLKEAFQCKNMNQVYACHKEKLYYYSINKFADYKLGGNSIKEELTISYIGDESLSYDKEQMDNAISHLRSLYKKQSHNAKKNKTSKAKPGIIHGVYSITDKNSGGTYIGQSKDINQRFKTHIYALEKGKHHSYKLQNVYNITKNIDDLEFKILYIFEDCDEATLLYGEAVYYLIYTYQQIKMLNVSDPLRTLIVNAYLKFEEASIKAIQMMENNMYGLMTTEEHQYVLKTLSNVICEAIPKMLRK